MLEIGAARTRAQRLVTLPAHETCRHRHYRLTCDQFEELLQEAGGKCQVCALPEIHNSGNKLFIDHDAGRGNWAVRGLLCNACNTLLGKDREVPRNDAFARYLRDAWYLRMLAKRGVPVDGGSEPPVGGKVRDGNGREWVRKGPLWTTRDSRVKDRTWRQLVRDEGPHALTRVREDYVMLPMFDPAGVAESLRAHMDPESLGVLLRLLSPSTEGP